MSTHRLETRVGVPLVLLLLLVAAPGHAQLNTGGSGSNFGTVKLSPGFTPDPHAVSVMSGGDVDVRALALGTGCVGYATSQPDYIVQLSGSSSRLRFFHEGDGDTGLVVNDPNGGWHCNDDSYGGVSPTVDVDAAPAGQYDVWITSYSSGDNISGRLNVTELDRYPGWDEGATALESGGDESNFGRVTLSAGFTPDPRTVTITSGGNLDVRAMDLGEGCVGYATGRPDFIVDLTDESAFLRFFVNADGDTGLVINDPEGSWRCNDDAHGGLNPAVDLRDAPIGQYDVWVTSYSSGENISGTLHVTELESQRPNG
jgi:hypothetical protein